MCGNVVTLYERGHIGYCFSVTLGKQKQPVCMCGRASGCVLVSTGVFFQKKIY